MAVHNFSMSTKANANSGTSATTQCALTLGDSLTQDEVTLCIAQARIKLQAQFRANGTPSEWSGNAYNVCNPAKVVSVEQVSQAADSMSLEQKRELLAKLQASLAE